MNRGLTASVLDVSGVGRRVMWNDIFSCFYCRKRLWAVSVNIRPHTAKIVDDNGIRADLFSKTGPV